MYETLTSRERILKALNHEETDRVPMDLGGTHDSSIVVEGYEQLKAYFGFASKTEIMQRMTRAAMVDEAVLRKLGIDTRAVIPGAPTRGVAAGLGPRAYRDMWGIECVHPEGSYYYDQRTAPLAGCITVADVSRYPWPDPEDPGLLNGMKERLAWIRAHSDAAAVLTLPARFVHLTQFIRGFESWYTDFILGTDVLEALFDAVLEITLRIAERELNLLGPKVDLVRCGDDLGGQTGLQNGSKLVFWGGTDSQKTIPYGTVEDVKKMVEGLAETLGRSGGYVFSSCHNIQPDVSAEKVVALFAHARKYVPSCRRR